MGAGEGKKTRNFGRSGEGGPAEGGPAEGGPAEGGPAEGRSGGRAVRRKGCPAEGGPGKGGGPLANIGLAHQNRPKVGLAWPKSAWAKWVVAKVGHGQSRSWPK